MKRLTPKKVLTAFKKHKMLPIQCEFSDFAGACCGLTAAVDVPKPRGYSKPYSDTVRDKARSRGFSTFYIGGFIDGWDGLSLCDSDFDSGDYPNGHADGKAAWKLCKKELLRGRR